MCLDSLYATVHIIIIRKKNNNNQWQTVIRFSTCTMASGHLGVKNMGPQHGKQEREGIKNNPGLYYILITIISSFWGAGMGEGL